MGEKIQYTEIKDKNSNGMTLLELAIAMTIMGVVIAGLISIVNPIIESGKIKVTEKRMERIIDVMAIYAQRNNRIPCPSNPDQAITAQPFGAEIGSGGGGNTIGSCDGTNEVEGIVPYKTLGMNERDIIDGWGNYLTYRISSTYARDPSTALPVHSRCRTELIWIDDVTLTNRNPSKARFCCADNSFAGDDFTIDDEAGDALWSFTRDAGNYASANTSVPSSTPFDPAVNNVTMPAFLLISHGKNGLGSFLTDGTRMAVLGTAGTGETENQDGDNLYVTSPRNTIQTNAHFDDILIWRTQDQLYSETGEGSCVFP